MSSSFWSWHICKSPNPPVNTWHVAQFTLEIMQLVIKANMKWPVSVTLCFCSQTDEVFLEAQIQNITTSPMFMEKVSLEPSMMYNVTELNTVTQADKG